MRLIELESISRRYPGRGSVLALDGVDLTIDEGDFVAIEGPSGGGKSTLLNIIGMLDAPTAGSYRIGGVATDSLVSDDTAKMRSQNFAFIFQGFHLLDRRPVVDSVELGLLYRGVPPAERRKRALTALGDVGLGHRSHHMAANLSGGERQRVAIARALASQAPIVVADEPTGNLDSHNSAQIVENLRRLHRSGATIVLVTHSPEIASVASRRIVVRDGRIEAQGSSKAALVGKPPGADRTSAPGSPSRLRGRDLVSDALRAVRSRMGRTAGLAAAVGVGVALFVGTLGVSGTANAQVSDAFDAVANRDVTVSWNSGDPSNQGEAEVAELPTRLKALNGVDEAGLVAGLGQTIVRAADTRPSFDVDGYAMTTSLPAAARMKVIWAPRHGPELDSDEVLIGATLADKLQLGPLEMTPSILVNDHPADVVGVIEQSPRFPQFLGTVMHGPGTVTGIQGAHIQAVLLTQSGAAQQVARQAPLVINPYDVGALDVDAPTDPVTLRNHVQGGLQSTLLALTAISLLASALGLTNSMVMSVLERKHELGLRRAVGARSRHVGALVLTESVITGTVGGLGGLVVGLAGILAITVAEHWSPVFDLALAPAAVGGGVLVGALGGLVAAKRAAAIAPHEALRS
ncbi:ATP-binding cassette domain-containing protein [Leifsonia sp. SIMBA_070]|uniref:ABC transporter ATP-binding protein/permease n=1 Tax=Leifsonia sp. SIMBA_070 TaxID=3085810 RepID=UPI00397C3D30